ncbi:MULTISPECIES: hypothetical protein [unclassified Rhizobium]|uniref:hypothetical protein n=1 Tax=unclassified Rhizobium TaxID=2613769 RepID=UPI000716217F|nr:MULTISPECIES: hypothetical protein [unclassified Rhizobium]KQS87711.1 hypothetical protein ASG42_20075 [Rhizobium sp. Leaf391]KQT07147.1 hypothetical protein ASG50_01620 [Rhizobium sp. Leaf386]KQT95273.1 hypothetical protein ASG68_14885 [Rhizobium sp. Leaf453]
MNDRCEKAGRRWAAIALVAGVAMAALGSPAFSQDDLYPGRPGLAGPEGTPPEIATCETIGKTLDGFKPARDRVDLWISGPLTLVHTDKVLWYLAVCPDTGIRVMCVTYSDNGMKIGDRVVLAGALEVQDRKHAVLDPCLASRE